jgi:hypothetical protein
MNKTLVDLFIRAFYETLWDRKTDYNQKLVLDVLAGDHNEKAFVEVKTDLECLKLNKAPLIKSHNEKIQVFVNHIDAVSLMRAQLSKFFT